LKNLNEVTIFVKLDVHFVSSVSAKALYSLA